MIITKTPFRLSFFGGGTDFPEWYSAHGGQTLAATIDKYAYVSVRRLPPFFEHKTRVVRTKVETVNSNEEIEHPAVAGALKYLGIEDGLEIHYDGDLPARSGMGSSSAFMVGLLHAIYSMQGVEVTRLGLAVNATRIEREVIGETVGVQDQMAVAFGGLNKLTIDKAGIVTVEPYGKGLPNWHRQARLRELNDHLMLYYTGMSRFSSDVASKQVARMGMNGIALERMAAQVDHGLRILEGDGPIEDFGHLLDEAWRLKRSLAPEISSEALNALYDRFKEAGAIGGKITGAGGGGFFLVFVPPESQGTFRDLFRDLVEVPFRFDQWGSQVIFGSVEAKEAVI